MRTGVTLSATDKANVLVHDEGLKNKRTTYQQKFVQREPAFEGEEVPEDEGEWSDWEARTYDLTPWLDTGVPTVSTVAQGDLAKALNGMVNAAERFRKAAGA